MEKTQKIENTLECIELLMDKMHEKNIAKLEYSCEEFELRMEFPQQVCISGPAAASAAVSFPSAGDTAAAPAAKCGKIVKAPIVGTYYNSPAPDKDPFITVGQKVKKGDILMIIESMKLMNEIQSEYDGVVAEIMVSSGSAVEFDQPLIRIE